MKRLNYAGNKRLSQSTNIGNLCVEEIPFKVRTEYPTATFLPDAGDSIAVRRMHPNVSMFRLAVFIPPGAAWSGGAIKIGWRLDGAHPHDVVQNPTHRVPHVDETLFEEADYISAGVTPTAAGAEAITFPIYMKDYEYNGHKPWRAFNWDLTIEPASAPAEGDEILLLMYHKNHAT